MSYFQSFILGVIQGVTEFLPVSSSGHLAITQHLLNLNPPLAFDIFLHLGTLFSVLFIMQQKIVNLVKKPKADNKLLVSLAIATTITAIAGLSLHSIVEQSFNSLKTVGFFMIATSVLLFLTRKACSFSVKTHTRSIILGLAQSFALFPGLSRSGATISTGLILGLAPKEAFEFSFLLYIPAVVGALLLESIKTRPADIQNLIAPGLIGMVTSFAIGVLSLKALRQVLVSNKLWYFSIYCFALGMLIILI